MMQYTEDQKIEIKRLFASRRKRQILVAIPIVAMIILLALSESKGAVLGVPLRLAGPVFFVCVLGAVAFSLYNWRCPACNKYLGKAIGPKFCARCGVELS